MRVALGSKIRLASVLGICLMWAGDHVVAQTPGDEPKVATPPAPNLEGVRGVVKDSVKEAIPKVAMPGLPKAAAPQANAKAPPQDAAARAAMLRRKTLKDEDFVEDDRNRDPFRSFLVLFTNRVGPRAPKVPAIFEKFSLEELKLIAIVSGDANPRAMFRDPTGLGQAIKRGDYLSKSGARISKILSDRVIIELNESTATGETRVLEKAILVNPEGENNE